MNTQFFPSTYDLSNWTPCKEPDSLFYLSFPYALHFLLTITVAVSSLFQIKVKFLYEGKERWLKEGKKELDSDHLLTGPPSTNVSLSHFLPSYSLRLEKSLFIPPHNTFMISILPPFNTTCHWP